MELYRSAATLDFEFSSLFALLHYDTVPLSGSSQFIVFVIDILVIITLCHGTCWHDDNFFLPVTRPGLNDLDGLA